MLVTGGTSGIGNATCAEFANAGWAVVVHGLDPAEAERCAARIRADGGTAVPAGGRLELEATAEDAVAVAIAAFGRLDAVVTSAGIQRYGDVIDTTPEAWDEVVSVNLRAVYLTVRAAMPHLRLSTQGSVTIVASVQGTASQRNVVAYSATKGALLAFTRALAVDEGPRGVRVNSVSPGSIDTPMLRAAAVSAAVASGRSERTTLASWGTAHALERLGEPQEVAAAIAFLASKSASFVTGSDFRVDGGMLARLPEPALREDEVETKNDSH